MSSKDLLKQVNGLQQSLEQLGGKSLSEDSGSSNTSAKLISQIKGLDFIFELFLFLLASCPFFSVNEHQPLETKRLLKKNQKGEVEARV